jgi:hypothetical protein
LVEKHFKKRLTEQAIVDLYDRCKYLPGDRLVRETQESVVLQDRLNALKAEQRQAVGKEHFTQLKGQIKQAAKQLKTLHRSQKIAHQTFLNSPDRQTLLADKQSLVVDTICKNDIPIEKYPQRVGYLQGKSVSLELGNLTHGVIHIMLRAYHDLCKKPHVVSKAQQTGQTLFQVADRLPSVQLGSVHLTPNALANTLKRTPPNGWHVQQDGKKQVAQNTDGAVLVTMPYKTGSLNNQVITAYTRQDFFSPPPSND